jgi:hypothetical protein
MVNLFIVGVGRSGTSLLHSMFAANKNISAFPETAFLRRYIFSDTSSELLISDEMVKRKQEFAKFGEYGKDKWLDLYIKELNKNLISLEKDPRLIEYVRCIVNRIPGSKVIHIYRDPRDVLLSKKKADWSKGRSLLSYLIAGAAQLRLLKMNSNLVEHVKYEDLIANPEAQLRKLCSALAVGFDEDMLDHRDSAEKLTHDDEKAWKGETLQPVLTNNYNKWKGNISGVEIAAVYFSNQWIYRFGKYDDGFEGLKKVDIAKGYLLGKFANYLSVIYVIIHMLKQKVK